MTALRARLALLGLYVLAAACCFAQTTAFEGKTIAEIQFEPPNVPLAQQDLSRLQILKKGDPFHLTDAGTAIDQLFASGVFEDVQVDVQPSGSDSVVVRFLTIQATFVGHVGIAGKTGIPPPNRGQMANASRLNLGTPYHDPDMPEARAGILHLLENEGFREATVVPKVTHDDNAHSSDLTFVVKPGKRAKFTFPIIHGHPMLSDQAVLRATGWRVPLIHWWRQATQATTRGGVDGIERKYQKQDRLTATVKIDSLDYQPAKHRIQPTLTLEAGPKVEVKAVEAKISKSRLRSYVPVYEEGAADRDLLVEGARNLRDYFQSQGYYDVGVDFRTSTLKKDELLIEYVIAKGTRYKLVNVEIRGNKYFRAEALRERMFLAPAAFLESRNGRYSEAFRKKDEESIANLYRANGFRDVKVTSEVLNPYEGKDGQIGVVMHVDEGQQWFVGDVQVEGVNRLKVDTLKSRLISVPGQPYSSVNVASDRNTILTEYFSNGFPAADFQYHAEDAAEPNRVNLTYVIYEGRQQFVQDVILSGLSNTRRRIVEKQLALKPGDPLSPVAVTAGQRRLYELGIFAKVDSAIQNPDGATNYKRVLYDFEEANRYLLNFGFGAEIAQFGGTTNNLSSPGGTTGFSPRVSFDGSRLNFLGVGHTVSLRTSYSNLEKRATIEYLLPRFRGVDGQNITFSLLYDDSRDVRTFSSKREEASVQMARRFSKALNGTFRFSYRRVTTADVIIPSLLVPQLLQPLRIGILSANLVQDRRDNSADAHRGVYNTVDLGLASKYFGSQRNFARALVRNATYTPFGKNIVFARQTQFGVIFPYSAPAGISADDSVPLPERFFGGGSSTHRGFPFNQAGPRDIGTSAGAGGTSTEPTGFPLGGNALFFNTFELRFPLLGSNIGGVVFHDAGNVFRSVSDVSFRSSQHNLQDFNYMVHAAGVGVRYKTPIGPIRIDLAYSINPPSYVGFQGTTLQLLACNPALPPTGVCVGVKQNVSHFQFSFAIGQAF